MYIQEQVFIYAIFCYYTHIKISMVTSFFFTNKVCKKVGYQNTLSAMNRLFVINYIAE